MKFTGLILLAVFSILFLFTGCGAKMDVQTDPMSDYDVESDAAMSEDVADDTMDDSGYSMDIGQQDITIASSARMVHYKGFIKLRATKPSDVIDKVSKRITSAGGYIEKISEGLATYRVPVNKFRQLYDEILTFGIVLEKEMTATDVTDSYTDIKQKIKIATQARNRYLELLSQTTDEKEKLALLKEISRLTEELEQLENSLATLTSLAAYSRLTVAVVPFKKVVIRAHENDIAEFQWIHSLTPFSQKNARKGEKLVFQVPEDMVRLGRKYWVTESADGTVFWAYKQENNPKGDKEFWIRAIQARLKKEFASADVISIGNYRVLRLTSFSQPNYVYCVGVNAGETEVAIIEVYYPTMADEKQYGEAIKEAIENGAK